MTETEVAPALAMQMRAIFRTLKRRLRERDEHGDLTPSQVAVVLRLEKDGPATVSGLARAEGMRPQSMSAVMTPLQEAGLVEGAADPNDGRQTLMALTPQCVTWLTETRAARQDWLTKRIVQTLSVAEQERVLASLELLMKVVED